ncbi:MAG TPA: sigma-70 family RNA polymerase sigma factor [Candidatus Limnocylindria bacterium]|nr:sigma-70 family RNA polymerase sigma factor [Candidatus Limnocylindria bacterium]
MEDRPPSEAELVQRARDGDGVAFGALVALHADVAFRTAYLLLANVTDAEDATQEAFVKVHRSLARFRDGEPFRPWLLTIVGNTARNRRRTLGRRMALQLRAEAAEDRARAPSPEAQVLDAERRRRLLDAINGLRPDDRLVIGARYFLELSEAETAALAGVAPGTVKSRLSRARARLADALGERAEWRDD